MKKLKIGFIGNFGPPFSTENDRKWSFEKLGHEVVPFQENEVNYNQLMHHIDSSAFDVFFYSHTHGWEIDNLKGFFEACKRRGIPTVSVHLDRWAGLARESDMGQEATWFTEYMFMADFSPEAQELYAKHNVNAYYLKPGVVERDCRLLPPDRKKFPHAVVFVGSKGYHPEYPFRPQLIEFLHATYGRDFGHYGNDGIRVVRGDELNVLYNTALVAVGDSCFGGRENYVSDRYYETRGRGGFLIHPNVPGVDNEGVWHYESGNLQDLKKCIDLALEHADDREKSRLQGFEWVKNNETYTHRAQEMLEVIFGDA